VRKGHQRPPVEFSSLADRRHAFAGDQHQFLIEGWNRRKASLLEGLRHKGRLDLEALHLAQHRAGRAGLQLDCDIGVLGMKG